MKLAEQLVIDRKDPCYAAIISKNIYYTTLDITALQKLSRTNKKPVELP